MSGSASFLPGSSSCESFDDVFSLLRLPLRELNALRANSSELLVRKRETLFYEGDKNEALFLVLSGAVRLTKLMPDGRYQITGFGFSGDFIGISFENEYIYSAEPLSRTSFLMIKRPALSRLLSEYPLLSHYFFDLACNDLREAQDHMVLLGRKSAIERISSLLVRLQERIGSIEDEKFVIQLPMSREDIAAYTGLSIETVSRVFTDLRLRGIISLINNTYVTLEDSDALRQLASSLRSYTAVGKV
jgi:CRP/FNR family transcriptional regulator